MKSYRSFVDESGHKSKAATIPSDREAFGVAVSILAPEDLSDHFVERLRRALPFSLDSESHITDWDSQRQGLVRSIVFEQMLESQVMVLYAAIKMQGFHEAEHAVLERLKQDAKAAYSGPMKIGSSPSNPSSHASILSSIMLKSIAHVSDIATDNGDKPSDYMVNFVLDTVDDPIVREVESSIREVVNFNEPKSRTVKGYNTETGKLDERTITMAFPDEEPLVLANHSIVLAQKTNCGILAADVVSNALNHHLKSVIREKGPATRLNQKEAISGFGLAPLIVGFCAHDIDDTLYGVS